MKDYDKLLCIAQTYGFIHGIFTTDQLYEFILSHNFKFKSTGITKREIGNYLNKSKKFKVIKKENNISYFEAIDKTSRRF